ncbi:MAG: replication initiation protein [Schleiferiaceae bacterium]
MKPLRYLAAVEEGLRAKLGADEGFAGLMCKTPHHTAWRTFEARFEAVYDLGELAEWVDLPSKPPKRLGIRRGIGRNVELFDRLRAWAYRWLADYKPAGNFERWAAAVLGQCEKYNDFAQPLQIAEVRSTAKSVAKWTWQKYTGRMDDKDFSKLQAARRKIQGKRTAKKIEEVNNG